MTTEEIKIGDLHAAKDNPRQLTITPEVKELAESLKRQGLLQPLIVRKVGKTKGYEIVCGHRRWLAAKCIGVERLRCEIKSLDDSTAQEFSLVENLQRENLPPLEEAEAFCHLVSEGNFTFEDVALKVGKTPHYVSRRMQLAKLSKRAKAWFLKPPEGTQTLSLSGALALARLEPKVQDAILDIQRYDPITARNVNTSWRVRFQRHISKMPWPLAATWKKGIKPCEGCLQRTDAQRFLFSEDEVSAGICLDISCYEAKVKSWIETARAANKDLVLVSDCYRYGTVKPGEPIPADHWTQADGKKDCGHRKAAITDADRSDQPGRLLFVCFDKNCPVHSKELNRRARGYTPGLPGPRVVLSVDERMKRNAAKIAAEKRRALFAELAVKAPISFDEPDLQRIAQMLINRAGHNGCRAIVKALDWIPKDDKTGKPVKGLHNVISLCCRRAEGMERAVLIRFIQVLPLYGELSPYLYGGGPVSPDPQLKIVSKLWCVDRTGIYRETEKAIRARYEKRQPKPKVKGKAWQTRKQAKSVKPKKAKATKKTKLQRDREEVRKRKK